jgi:hypothetical protein
MGYKFQTNQKVLINETNCPWYRPFVFKVIAIEERNTGHIYKLISKDYIGGEVNIHEDYLLPYFEEEIKEFEKFYDTYFF